LYLSLGHYYPYANLRKLSPAVCLQVTFRVRISNSNLALFRVYMIDLAAAALTSGPRAAISATVGLVVLAAPALAGGRGGVAAARACCHAGHEQKSEESPHGPTSASGSDCP
jgi:hypothetical protein